MRVLSIVGYHNTGKTTLVEGIIKELTKRKNTVGTIKDIHIDNFSIDTPGKDSWRYKEAGAHSIGICSPVETSIIFPRRFELSDLITHFQTDYIILEGFSKAQTDHPRIVCAETEEQIPDHLTKKTVAISGIISDRIDVFRKIPVLKATKDLETIISLIDKAFGNKRNK